MADSSDSKGDGMFCFSGTNNWPIWKEKMEDILYCKNLYLPLDGDSKKPDSTTEEEWRVLNRQTCGTIRKWLDVSVCHYVFGVTSASEMWSKLHERYESKTVRNKTMMFRKLVNMKYKDGTSVSEHLNEFQSTVNQLSVMKIVLEEEVQAMLLLNTLPNSWETLVVSVSNSTPDGKLMFPLVHSALLNEETRRKVNGEEYPSLSTGLPFGQSATASTSEPSKSCDCRIAMASPLPEGSNSDKGGKNVKAGNLLERSGHTTSSGLSASTIPSLSNGSLISRPSASEVVVTPSSNGSALSSFTAEAATFTSPISPSISTTAPTFPAVPSCQFGSVASTGAPVSVSPAIDKSSSTESKTSPLSTSAAIAFGISTTFPTSSPSMTCTISNTSNGFLMFGAPAQSSSSSLSVATATNTSQDSSGTFGSTDGPFVFGSSAPSLSTGLLFGQLAPASTSQPTKSSIFGSTTSSPFGQSAPALSSQQSKSSLFGSTTSSLSTGFSFRQSISTSSAQLSKPIVFGSTAASSASTGLSFGQSAKTSGSQPCTRFVLGSSTTSPLTGFSFGQSTPASSSQKPTPSIFGSSPSPPVTFGASISPSPTQPVFGFGSESLGNDQMNEDSMADDTNRVAAPVVPTFGQLAANPPSNFAFGSPAASTGGPLGFQFGGQQNPSVPQSSPSPIQAPGNLVFPPSGREFFFGQ